MTPNLIHFIVGSSPSPLVIKCLDSWEILKQHNFEIRIWNDETIIPFITTWYPWTLEAIRNARNRAEAADISRFALVYHFGGYYIDWDIQLLDVEKFIELCESNPNGYLIQDPVNQTIAPEAFSATKEEPFLLSLLENITDIYKYGFRDSMTTPFYSGPFRMREVLYFNKMKTLQNIKRVKEVFLYDYSEIRLKPKRDIEVPMIHYWAHAWIKH
jgi:mannosyltransferase OCH1-like enzyme